MVVATLFGSPLASTALLALNARTLGRSVAGVVAFGLGCSALLLAIGWGFPAARMGLALVAVPLMGVAARVQRRGVPAGEDGSWGIVAGAAFVGFVGMMAVLLPFVLPR